MTNAQMHPDAMLPRTTLPTFFAANPSLSRSSQASMAGWSLGAVVNILTVNVGRNSQLEVTFTSRQQPCCRRPWLSPTGNPGKSSRMRDIDRQCTPGIVVGRPRLRRSSSSGRRGLLQLQGMEVGQMQMTQSNVPSKSSSSFDKLVSFDASWDCALDLSLCPRICNRPASCPSAITAEDDATLWRVNLSSSTPSTLVLLSCVLLAAL